MKASGQKCAYNIVAKATAANFGGLRLRNGMDTDGERLRERSHFERGSIARCRSWSIPVRKECATSDHS